MNLQSRDVDIVSRGVPAHMMALMVEACMRQGFEVRADVFHHLSMAAGTVLAKLDTFSIARLAKRIDEVATTLLTDLSPDDAREGLYCTCMFVLLLVTEDVFADVTNQAVLVATLFMDDAKDDKPDVNGNLPVYAVKETRWTVKAKSMLLRANLMGLYLPMKAIEGTKLQSTANQRVTVAG
jgi:hypothetical protein